MTPLWCLHGNLQQPEVWSELTQTLQVESPTLQIRWINLWETLEDDCWAWANTFCETVRRADGQHYLLGYSLGGRLGWHALITQPELWTGAVIVSADVGVASRARKEECLHRDRTWATRFLTEPWDSLLAEWDTLPVFCGCPCCIFRPEATFDRQKIAHAFVAYSKGRMDDLTNRLRSLSVPMTYVSGSDDRRYCQLGQTLQRQIPTLTHLEIKDAGHRVPWEQSRVFSTLFIKALAL